MSIDPIAQLSHLADPFRFDIPRSHRGVAGLGITAAKRIFVGSLKPMHIETLRPQREFNYAVIGILGQISGASVWRNADAPAWIRSCLASAADPAEWRVRSHRGSLVGGAVALSKTTYLNAVEPVLKELLEAQRQFNLTAIECLTELALCRLRPGEGALRRLEALADPLSAVSSPPVRATKPLWNEVFRAQLAFNRQLVASLTWMASFQPAASPFFPTISVIALKPEARFFDDFLVSTAMQQYPAAFELIVADEGRDGALSALLHSATRRYDWLRVVSSQAAAFTVVQGDVVVVTDSRRLLGPGFLESLARPYLVNERTQAVTTPLPQPAGSAPWEKVEGLSSTGEDSLFDAVTPTSFVNFATGAFAVARPLARELAQMVDPIDAGYRLYDLGVRVVHAPEALSLTLVPSPAEERPIETFLERKPETSWVVQEARQSPVRRVRPATKRLRILTYRWHCAHQYELFKLPHDFTLMMGAPRVSREWDFNVRPLRPNARMVPRERLSLNDFDLAILPFDESCVNPALANGVVPPDWGALFRELRQELRIPMIALCHGTVPFHGQFDNKHERPNLVIQTNEPERQKIVDFVGDVPVICNSHQAEAEWKFKDSRVIWHGFDPAEYPRTRAVRGAITITPGLSRRPHYCGYYLFKKATVGVQCDVLGDDIPGSVKVPDAPRAAVSGNEFAHHRFRNYIDFLREYSVFFNPTLLSPMPRCRAEAMLCGLAMVTTPNHDASMFIRDGVNGFCSGDADEIRGRLKYLAQHPEAARKLGEAGRETAIREFHIDRYLGEWHKLIARVVG